MKTGMVAGAVVIAALGVTGCSSSSGPSRDAMNRWCTYAKAARVVELAHSDPSGAYFVVKGLSNSETPPKIRSAVSTLVAGIKAMQHGSPVNSKTNAAAAKIDHYVAAGCK